MNMAKLLSTICECRPLFEAEAISPYLSARGRECAKRDLADYYAVMNGDSDKLEYIALHACVLSSYADNTPEGRGLALRMRGIAQESFPRAFWPMPTKLYHLDVVRDGKILARLTRYPMPHEHCETLASKACDATKPYIRFTEVP